MQTHKNSATTLTIIWIASIALSILVRTPALAGTSYMWRPIASEITTFWFEKEGINLVNYQTPLLGPPWQAPLEFPLFQAMAAVISRAGLNDTEFASRLSALLCFYLSAFFLFLVCTKIFADDLTRIAIISLYLWLPYNIYYSTEPYMDYLALGLALAYLFFILSWLQAGSSLVNLLGATISGSLATLVKPMTTPIVAIPIVVFVGRDLVAKYHGELHQPFDLRGILARSWNLRIHWLSLIGMAAIPVLIGAAWTWHADRIKEQSIYTQWLTSQARVTWNFGTWELRSDPKVWIDRAAAVQSYFSPYGLTLFVTLGILVAVGIIKDTEAEVQTRLFVISVLLSVLLVLSVFLSLYFYHDYYYMALSASMAILGGYGLASFWRIMPRIHPKLKYVFAIWGLIFILGNYRDYNSYREIAFKEGETMAKSRAWAASVRELIPADKWIVVLTTTYQGHAAYLLQRKALVVDNQNHDMPLCPILRDNRFAFVILSRLQDTYRPENESRLGKVLGCFKSYVEVLPDVYQVTH